MKQKTSWSGVHFFIFLSLYLLLFQQTFSQKNLTAGDLIQLYGLKASMDGTLNKYIKDPYERKRLAKLDMEAIILITPDIFPSPFHVGNLDVYPDSLVLPVNNDFFNIRTGLRLDARGDKEINDPYTFTSYVYYLTLPAYLMYNHYLHTGLLFGGFGPYYGYGLFGKYISDMGGQTTRQNIKFGENNSGLRHGDFGLGLVAGYGISHIFLQLSYDFGLSNIFYASVDDAHTRAIGISVGYSF
jgi:hypothetical protein